MAPIRSRCLALSAGSMVRRGKNLLLRITSLAATSSYRIDPQFRRNGVQRPPTVLSQGSIPPSSGWHHSFDATAIWSSLDSHPNTSPDTIGYGFPFHHHKTQTLPRVHARREKFSSCGAPRCRTLGTTSRSLLPCPQVSFFSLAFCGGCDITPENRPGEETMVRRSFGF